jgi:hypothetical protein
MLPPPHTMACASNSWPPIRIRSRLFMGALNAGVTAAAVEIFSVGD